MEDNKEKPKVVYKQKPRIAVPDELKGLLDNMKTHPKERYEDVIARIVKEVEHTINSMNKNKKEVEEDGTGK